ncbi:MAG TPA: hypothetical protein VJ740_12790 [Hyphomicrobiaceae bacterium]|nr:hypothetical protein [Hyphomicrobiaceae bacterium]
MSATTVESYQYGSGDGAAADLAAALRSWAAENLYRLLKRLPEQEGIDLEVLKRCPGSV